MEQNLNIAAHKEIIYEQLFEALPGAVVIAGNDGCIHLINKSTKEIFGYTSQELTGRPVEILITEEAREKYVFSNGQYLKKPEHFYNILELEGLKKDGTRFPMEMSFSRMPARGGSLLCIMIQDVCRRRKAIAGKEDFKLSRQVLLATAGQKIAGRKIVKEKSKGEEQYKEPVENIADFICTHALDGTIISMNAAAEQFIGQKITPQGNLNIKDILHPSSKNEFENYIETIKKNGQAKGLMKVKAKNGETRIWEYNNTLKTDRHNTAIRSFARDITEQKNTERTLRQSKAFVESIINASPDIIYIYDVEESKNIFINDGIQNNLGYTVEEIKQMGSQLLPLLMHPDDFKYYTTNIYPLYATAKDKEYIIHEFRMHDKEGKWHWLHCKESVFLRNEDGSVKQISGITSDVTERKKTEEELQNLATIVQRSPEFIGIASLDGKGIYLNDGGKKIVGLDTDVTNTTIFDYFAPPDLHFFKTTVLPAVQKNGKWFGDLYFKNFSNGNRIPVLMDIFYVYHPQTNEPIAYATVTADLTERKKAEYEIAMAQFEKEITLNRINDAVLSFDNDWRFTYINDAALILNPLTREETIGQYILDVHPELEGTSTWIKYQEAMLTKTVTEVESFYEPYRLWIYAKIYPSDDGITFYYKDITEQKKTEADLKRSQLRIRKIFDSEMIGFVFWDANGEIMDANDKFLKMTGYSREDLKQGKINWNKMTPPEYLELDYKGLEQLAITGYCQPFEKEYYCKDGSRLHVLLGATSFDDTDAREGVAYVMDISERKKIEKEIKEFNERFNLINKVTNDALYEWNFITKEVWWSEGHFKLFGFDPALPVPSKKEWHLRIHEEDRKRLLEKESEVFQNKIANWQDEIRFLKPGNIYGTALLRCYVLYNQNGEPNRLIGSFVDITERKKAQEQILLEKELSDTIINSLPGIFYLFSQSGDFLRWNRNLETVSGYTTEEIMHMHPLQFFGGNEKTYIENRIKKVFETGNSDAEAFFVTKMGSQIPYYFTGVAVNYNGQTCLLGTGTDITSRKTAENELKKINQELHQLSSHLQNIREEERISIAREIHDELGQQLTGLKMDVYSLLKNIAVDNDLVAKKLSSLLNLIDDTVRSVRRISSNLRPSILDDLGLVAALEWHSQEVETRSGIKVDFECTQQQVDLPGNIATALFRIYQEALNNAVKHSNAKNINGKLFFEDNLVKLEVCDNGIGMDLTAKNNQKTFGLSGIKERTYLLQGKYELKSSPGKGTLISIAIALH